jgi:hypothetical protein
MHVRSFLEDERSLSGRLGIDLPPLRKFDLHTFGIDPGRFLREQAASFDQLPWDFYDVKRARVQTLRERFPDQQERLDAFLAASYAGRQGLEAVADLLGQLPAEERDALEAIRPSRRRSLSAFAVHDDGTGRLEAEHVPVAAFEQKVAASDCRSLQRVFAETPRDLASHPDFRRLLAGVLDVVAEVAAPRRPARVFFHQIRTVARADTPGVIVPEGIHQDGVDYIVSALVIERVAVVGGESAVYGPDRATAYLRTVLLPGQGLFQADSGSSLWHGVTPIQVDPDARRTEGYRSVFGFDIHLGN